MRRETRTKTFDVIAFSEQDRAAFARVASLMDKARGLLDDPDSDADYEMARLEHAATEFAELEHIEGGDEGFLWSAREVTHEPRSEGGDA